MSNLPPHNRRGGAYTPFNRILDVPVMPYCQLALWAGGGINFSRANLNQALAAESPPQISV